MTRDDTAFWISEDRISEPELFDRRLELFDLALRMGPGVARIGDELANRAIGDGELRSGERREFFVHRLANTFLS